MHLGTTEVALPDQITAIVRHERTPHGTLMLRLEAEWSERGLRRATTSSLAKLID